MHSGLEYSLQFWIQASPGHDLGNLLNISVPQFPHILNGDNISTNLIGLLCKELRMMPGTEVFNK